MRHAGASRLGVALVMAAVLLATAVPARAAVGTPVDVPTPAPRVRITGGGWGHGVGMSQYGARAQAKAGWRVGRILRHWYPGVAIARTTASQRPVVVGLSTSAVAPAVTMSEGIGRWLRCDPRCRALRSPDGAPVRQRVADGAWSVAARGGRLSLRSDDGVVWSGPASTALRVRLSADERRRDVARVLGRRHRWGALAFGQWSGADCSGRRVCVTAILPSVERYLLGLAEMPSSWEAAALGAQAVVGRTFALRMRARGVRASCRCHLLATPADQAYVGLDKEEGVAGARWAARVRATAGLVVRYGGSLAATFYSSSHARRSEHVSDSYAFSAPRSSFPYLRSVRDRWSSHPAAGNPYAHWTATVGNRQLAAFVDDRLRRVTRVTIRNRTTGSTPRSLVVVGRDGAGRELTVPFAGRTGKPVGTTRAWIVGAELKQRFGLRSQQVRRIGFAPFVDDDGTDHEYALVVLAVADVFDGCGAQRSCHAAGLRRARAADMLARAFRLPSSGQDRFDDDDGSRDEAAIDSAAAAGIVRGCAARRFCPRQVLLRGQMASLLARAFELPPTNVDAFRDDDRSAHADNINRLAAAGITVGASDGRFRPRRRVTTGQMAAFLVRGLEALAR